MSVFRVFVEKKPGYDIEAGAVLHEIKHIFGIETLTGLRLINRYDVEGMRGEYIGIAKQTVFSEPQIDNIYEDLPDDYDYAVAVQYLPGQFDQRADSCAQCLQMLSGGELPLVRSSRIYLLSGALNDNDLQTIKKLLINPVECMEASMEVPETLVLQDPIPKPAAVLSSFLILEQADLPVFCAKYGLAMDSADLALCREYFRKEGRTPTLTELRVIDTYWSDHCRHTTFLTNLKVLRIKDDFVREFYDDFHLYRETIGRKDYPITLMELATIGKRILAQNKSRMTIDESDEINACSVQIKVDEDGILRDWLLMFKNETHNHPTEIEPFGGAATCIGGAIRDPLAGRSYVYQAMRVTGSGDPTTPVSETLPGKLPQRSITTKAAKGYSSYGNQIGVATGLVREIYHPGYVAKRMEVGAVIGAVPKRGVLRQKPVPGDKIILLGGRTGRDGCGGATGSSKAHNADSLSECGAEVQKGNAPEERKIQRLFRNHKLTRKIKRCNDFGAGGIAVAVGELADGVSINLDAVPKKYSGLDGTELAISESQERMAVVVSAENVNTFIEMANEENLEATVIAEVTQTPRIVMNWNGRKVVDLSREFLDTNGAVKHASVAVGDAKKVPLGNPVSAANIPIKEFFALLLSDLNACSQKGLIGNFDSTIGSGTVLLPLGGKYQMTPAQTMAAKLPVHGAHTETCSLMSYAFYPEASAKNPYAAAYLAVAASIAKIIASGGSPSRCWLSFQEYFERLGDNPGKWGKPFSALLGALEAQLDLGVAAIGGKDSMSGSFEDLDVPPTLISFAVSVTAASNAVSGEFKTAGSDVILIAPAYREDGVPLGGSLKDAYTHTERLISGKKVLSAYVVEAGGVGEAVYKMIIGNRIGFEFDESCKDSPILTGHYIGSIILEMDSAQGDIKPEDWAADENDFFTVIQLGRTTDEYCISLSDDKVDCSILQELYEQRLESVFPTHEPAGSMGDNGEKKLSASLDELTAEESGWASRGSSAITNKELSDLKRRKNKAPVITGKPRVLIPVFPGTNCEYDMERSFIAAGADAEILVLRNLSASDIQWSADTLSKAINRSQILALPGGFSGGDEPDGSAKFIVSMFRNPRIKDAVHELLNQRDGLMCGICNGFQALIKLGLVPFGEIIEPACTSPTLTFNSIGRHQSLLVRTSVVSNKSPWLSDTTIGDIHTLAVSHGEGRFIAQQSLIAKLAKNKQIAAQYVDFEGKPTMDIRHNPNGSMYAIEAITSPDGRILGKMGHNERAGDGLYVNYPEKVGHDIFTPAVKYYEL